MRNRRAEVGRFMRERFKKIPWAQMLVAFGCPLALFGALTGACGPGDPASVFTSSSSASGDPGSPGSSGDPGSSGAASSGFSSGDPGGPGSSGDPGSSGTLDDGGSCAAVESPAVLQPLNLIVMYDKSGSMGDTDESASYNPAHRWLPVGTAMKAFFAEEQSAGINAYLSFFPNSAIWSSDPEGCYAANRATATQCAVTNYDQVPARTALPSTALGAIIDGRQPCGDTPTKAAMDGAFSQVASIAAAHPQDRNAVVFVTDGEPFDRCGAGNAMSTTNTIAAVAAVVQFQHDTNKVNTYVVGVGVGTAIANMQTIATAGGTTAFEVMVDTPSNTTDQLLAAMVQIRGELAKCDFPIPSPPDGRTLDYNKVNVNFTSNGNTRLLGYNPTCAGDTGWKFDAPPGGDSGNPGKVVLCASTCDEVKIAAGGNIQVEFGCVRRSGEIN